MTTSAACGRPSVQALVQVGVQGARNNDPSPGELKDAYMSYITVRFKPFGQMTQINFPFGVVLRDDSGSSFKLQSAIKQGGNGIVFEAHRFDESGRSAGSCAVKLLKQLDDVRLDRFKNEVRILRQLDHPRVTRHYGHGVAQLGGYDIDIPWVALDIGGPNLRDYGDKYGQLDVPTAARICCEAAAAVAHLHEHKIIHRDIKPANFVWDHHTDREHVQMIDFGLAKFIGEDVSGRQMDAFTQQNEFVGPVHFSSPELIAYARDKSHSVDYRSDLFQIGMLIWFIFTNEVLAGIPSAKRDPTGGAVHGVVTELGPV